MRTDALGIFWEEPPKLTRSAKAKMPKRKPLPPPLELDLPATPITEVDLTLPVTKPPQVLMDIECYQNYFLIKFMRALDEVTTEFVLTENQQLDPDSIKKILAKYEVITFNGNRYDLLMLRLALTSANNTELKAASDQLIKTDITPWRFEEQHRLPQMTINHIDLVELTVGVLSLKVYGGRLHCPKMQDLPIDEDTILSNAQMKEISTYCTNDLLVTKRLLIELTPQINLRRNMSRHYGLDLRSRSDAQIAEEVIKAEWGKIKDQRIAKRPIPVGQFFYQAPDFIKFTHPELQKALEIVTTQPFTVHKNGRIEMPAALSTLKVAVGGSVYQMGMGGLHSTESTAYHLTNEQVGLFDFDVSSYYPAIILNCGLYPEHLGESFLDIYRNLVAERLAAKRAGDMVKANALKITVNGSFGKLGSPYSALYSPDLMVQVTVTGQLSLLMLIEMLERYDLNVVSGNTDGIVVRTERHKIELMQTIIARWEKRTGFEMEMSEYVGLYCRDVNNYIAIKPDGSVKTKGVFSPASLNKNPQNEICSIAMIEYLKYGTPFEDTIRNCEDITKFLMVRTVKGGAMYGKKYLGKAVRWYHAKGSKMAITYRNNQNQVAMTYGSKPFMDLEGGFPDDIDYQWYIKECYTLF